MKSCVLALALALLPAFQSPAEAAKKPLAQALQEFDRNPRQFMNQIPEKANRTKVQFFTPAQIRNRSYISAKNKNRKVSRGRTRIDGNDKAEDLVDNGSRLIRNLVEMENLRQARLPVAPWSDYYWSLFNGQLAYRYQDRSFPASPDWKKNSDYLLQFLPANTASARPVTVDQLSPAEKYDLLVGDKNMTLTKQALATGETYYQSDGEVESWMGICDGWAPASFMLERPKNAVSAMAADGKTIITFLPSDIKALASLLWAISPGEISFIGGRCDTKNPKMDSVGRINDADCFDTNPGTWHTAVVNQIGLNQRSLVMDATFDYEVWNHPIVAYNYNFFNPETSLPAASLEEAMVPVNSHKKDKFKKFRSKLATHVVGISMDVEYTVETNPSLAKRDGPENDATNTVTYLYDLEIDAKGKIIGGEWYNNAHPDFLWTPLVDSRAISPGDEMLDQQRSPKKWNGRKPLPKEWQEVAQRNSEGGSPLAVIVENLIELSNSRSAL